MIATPWLLLGGGLDVADGLAVQAHRPPDRPGPSPWSHRRSTSFCLVHADLIAIATSMGPMSAWWQLRRQQRRHWWTLRDGPMTGGGVVLSCWRKCPRSRAGDAVHSLHSSLLGFLDQNDLDKRQKTSSD